MATFIATVNFKSDLLTNPTMIQTIVKARSHREASEKISSLSHRFVEWIGHLKINSTTTQKMTDSHVDRVRMLKLDCKITVGNDLLPTGTFLMDGRKMYYRPSVGFAMAE